MYKENFIKKQINRGGKNIGPTNFGLFCCVDLSLREETVWNVKVY